MPPASLILVIIPGLGSENVPAVIPLWCEELRGRALNAGGAGIEVFIKNYTDASLPEWLAAMQADAPGAKLVIVGHSDGGDDLAWMANHAKKMNPPIHINLAVFLDRVNDIIRHGIITTIPASTVDRAVFIFQTADPIIHANHLEFDASTPEKTVERYGMAWFGQPGANHEAVAESVPVQRWIVAQLIDLVTED
jgi:hypothetical protein